MSDISQALRDIEDAREVARATAAAIDPKARPKVPVGQNDSKAVKAAKAMLEVHLGTYRGLPAKTQAVAIEFKRVVARIQANQDLSDEGKATGLAAAKQKRDQATAALRTELAATKDGVDSQLAVLRRFDVGDQDGNTKLLNEMQLSRAWERVKPRLQRSASDPKRTTFDTAGNVIREAKAANDRATLNALREELPGFIDAHDPAGDKQSQRRILEAITIQLDAAEAELSPDFNLAHQTQAETVRGYGVIHQSLNTVEGDDPSSMRVFDWPDQYGKVAQLAVD